MTKDLFFRKVDWHVLHWPIEKRRRLFRGGKRMCNLCSERVRVFLPYGHDMPVFRQAHVLGGGFRWHAVCPLCESRDRERGLYDYLTRHTRLLTEPCSLLHTAPETALKQHFVKVPTLEYYDCDLNPKATTHVEDLTQLTCADARFDYALCNHVLEHIPDDRKAIRELYRVLKPNGTAVISVPIAPELATTDDETMPLTPEERLARFGQKDHLRLYGMDFTDRLTEAGFAVELYHLTPETPHFAEYGLCENILFICRKP